MGTTPFLPLPSTLSIDVIEQDAQTLFVHLHATTLTVPCPRCGTSGSYVHSHYHRTVADVSCGGQRLLLKLLVRKWVCAEVSCSQRIFAERFPDFVQTYARMTDRLREALQYVGTTISGEDGARLFSHLAMPTTGKTIIRHVLQMPLPQDTPIRVAGVDEWAWKKGSHYGTILVDLEKHRVAALLPDRSTDTTAAWFAAHPEVEIVSRDRGKIFREAASRGAPQAQQITDQFHLQKNFGEDLEGFFRHHETILKTAARQLAGKAPALPKEPGVQAKAEQARKRRHAKNVRRHNQIWKLFRAGHRIDEIAQIVGVGSRSIYRALEHEQPPPRQRRSRAHTLVDPYLSYLSDRWNSGCHQAVQLYEEIMAQGYTGSLRTIERIVAQSRPHKTKLVSRQTVMLAKVPSPRNTALMMVRSPEHRTEEQTAFINQICQSNATIATAFSLTQTFGQLLRQRQGLTQLEHWKTTVRESGIVELIRFVDGLADDAVAIANACTQSWSNGMVEGFNHKVKLIKRTSYGQAGFPLLQRRILFHPAQKSLHTNV